MSNDIETLPVSAPGVANGDAPFFHMNSFEYVNMPTGVVLMHAGY